MNSAADFAWKLYAPLVAGMKSHLRTGGPAWRRKAKENGAYVKESRASAPVDPSLRRSVESRLARRVQRLVGRGDPHSVKMARKLMARA